MNILKVGSRVLLFALLAVVLGCVNTSDNKKSETWNSVLPEGNWIQLFNGKDLNDWDIKFTGHELGDNYNNTFRVENGMLRVSYKNWEEWNKKFGHIFYKGEFSNYWLYVEYRFVGDQVKNGPGWAFRNNGLMIHGQSAESMEIDQDFPTSIEVQLLGGLSGKGERSTMNLCTPGTNVVMNNKLVEKHCIVSKSKTCVDDEWVSVAVEVRGNKVIRHFLEGKEVMYYEKPQLDPRDKNFEKMLQLNGDKMLTKGTISLQAESHNTDFRKIELLEIVD